MNTIETLLIACGNPLRGDDGVAHVAAELVRVLQVPGVRILMVHQLTPELIEEIKQADRVLFMDAGMNAGDAAFEVHELAPKNSRHLFGHYESPENLLALMQLLEGRSPEAWQLSIRAFSFDHGEGLTFDAKLALNEAIAWIHSYLAEQSCTKSA